MQSSIIIQKLLLKDGSIIMKGKLKYLIVVLVVLQGVLLFMFLLFYQGNEYPVSTDVVHKRVNRTEDVTRDVIKQTIKPEPSKQDSKLQDSRVDHLNKTTMLQNERRSERCHRLKFQPELVDDSSWFPVDKAESMFVFSAYYIKARRKVFIIGVKRKHTLTSICQYWYTNGSRGDMSVTEHPAITRVKLDGKSKPYISSIFECHLGTDKVPSHISLVTRSCETPLNMLVVKDVSKPATYKTRFSVCLSPLYFNYSRAYELVEWIELNRILGAEKFTIYNISTSINVDKVLEYYSKRGVVEIVQWRLPIRVGRYPGDPSDIHYFGQVAALNDCLYRTKRDSEYLANVDLDEFIIPHGENMLNWTITIKPYENKFNVFMFKSTYFRKEWENDINNFIEKDLVAKYKLVSLKVVEHEGRIFAARHRSKYIARTASVYSIQIHEVPGARTAIIPHTAALLHHYRNWSNQDDRNGTVKDYTVSEKYGKVLIHRVHNVWSDLPAVQMDVIK